MVGEVRVFLPVANGARRCGTSKRVADRLEVKTLLQNVRVDEPKTMHCPLPAPAAPEPPV
jgi:hypothetical protein